ncbi:unnamed protein product [Urochloa humidicola]
MVHGGGGQIRSPSLLSVEGPAGVKLGRRGGSLKAAGSGSSSGQRQASLLSPTAGTVAGHPGPIQRWARGMQGWARHRRVHCRFQISLIGKQECQFFISTFNVLRGLVGHVDADCGNKIELMSR